VRKVARKVEADVKTSSAEAKGRCRDRRKTFGIRSLSRHRALPAAEGAVDVFGAETR